jgi:tetratricopeptide (TPR) repeat protein
MLLFLCSIGFAQTNRFEDLKQNIEKKIKSNLWDDVLLISTDLIIEDFTKGDGYYFTGLAFYKMGDIDNFNKYIAKAKSRADESLLEKIKVLEQTISSVAEAQLMVKSAIDFELSNNKKACANAWYQTWQYDKYRIEYALNAVSNYIDLKEYEKALQVLNQPEVYQDKMAKELIEKINKTPEMESLNGYNNSIKLGDNNLKAKSFGQAKSSYEEALKYKPNDQYAKSKITEVIEEIDWEKAINSMYVEDTEKYADKYPKGKYIDRANDLIKSSYISIAEKAFKDKNESKIVEFHNKYLERFPGDNDLNKIRDLLLNYYYTMGLNRYSNKEWSNAKSNFQAFLNFKNTGEQADKCRQLIKRCEWKINQKSSSFLVYTYDYQSPIGISIGNINKNSAGYYLNLKMNLGIFTGLDVLYKIDDAGNHDRPGSVVRTGEIEYANISLSGGVTFKIAYPLWGYIGGGLGYLPVYEKANTYFSSGNFWEEDWLKNTDKSKFGLFPEAGIKLKISNALVLKYGIMYRNDVIHQFGFGFNL